MHYVYILYSASLDRFYIGETADLQQRLVSHNAGLQRFTRRAHDWDMVFRKTYASRHEALRVEKKIKSAKSRATLQRWIKGPDNEVPGEPMPALTTGARLPHHRGTIGSPAVRPLGPVPILRKGVER